MKKCVLLLVRLTQRRAPFSLWLCFVCVLAGGRGLTPVGAATAGGAPATAQTTVEWIVLNLRSFTRGASGRLSIEPTPNGGRVRLTALKLPRPRNVSRSAKAYVVWAVSEGRFVRLGEMKLDSQGNGGLEFERPSDFARYTVMVTAEADLAGERPTGAPTLSTKANEAQAHFGTPGAEAGGIAGATGHATRPIPTTRRTRAPRQAGDFYSEVDDALDASGGGRALELIGAEIAPGAQGLARATAQSGSAYVRVRFRDLPLPSTVGANTYVLWGTRADGTIAYMGSLPVTSDLNKAEIYVRTGGFNADDYYLFVTAERQRPVPRPSEQRALSPRPVRYIVK